MIAMSQTISFQGRTAAPFRINASAVINSISAAAAAATVIATALGADIFAAICGTVTLAGVYTLDTKGGRR